MDLTRVEIGELIYQKLIQNKEDLKKQFSFTKDTIGFFYLDALLPEKIVLEIYKNFPSIKESVQRKSIRENKHTAYQMNDYNPILEEVIYAFQEKKIVKLVSDICEIEETSPDKNLYAAGLSLMEKDNFLNPHLDNSHDKNRNKWRVLNLLYYVTPDWKLENGGNLELWPKGLKEEHTTIESAFNRLVVMATHQKSWHSVSKVKVDKIRCCISNYYFSTKPLSDKDTFHITTFRAIPTDKFKDYALQFDNKLRTFVRKIFKGGIRENPHQYKK